MHRIGSHPFSEAAAYMCRETHAHIPSWNDVACSDCWNRVIEHDAQVARELDLPATPPRDTDYVDPVAVDRAITGSPVVVTFREWRRAMWRLSCRSNWTDRRAFAYLTGHVVVTCRLGNPIPFDLLLTVTHRPCSARQLCDLVSRRLRARRRAASRASSAPHARHGSVLRAQRSISADAA